VNKALIKGALAVFTGRILGLLANFGFNMVLARQLAPDQVGYYFLLFNLITFLAIFARFGCENYALKAYADAINRHRSGTIILTRVITLIIIASVGTTVIFWLASSFLFITVFSAPSLATLTSFIIAWFVLVAFQAVQAEILRAAGLFLKAALVKGTLTYSLNVIVVVGLFLFDYPFNLTTVLQLVVVNALITSLFGFYWIMKRDRDNQDNIADKSIKDITLLTCTAASIPLLINQAAMFITSQSDIWLLGAFYGPEATAYYGAAARLVLLTGLALTIANGVLPPFISKLRVNNDKAKLEVLVRVVATVTAIPAVIIISLFIFYSEEILTLIFGEQYAVASNILIILSVAQLVNVLVGSCGYLLIMHGYNNQFMVYSLSGGAISLLLSMLAIYYGLSSIYIAIGFSSGIIVQQLMMLRGCKTHVGITSHILIKDVFNHVKSIKA